MVKLIVCIGTGCHIKGSYNVINLFQQCIEEHNISDKIKVSGTFCLGNCANGVSVRINDSEVYSVSSLSAKKFFDEEVMSKL